MRRSNRLGFTLIEVLIVVVIMATLAATVIPQFANSAKDAKESSLRFNAHCLRNAIDLYKLHHNQSFPDGTNNLQQLTAATNSAGLIGATGATYPYGPYLRSLPPQPFSGLSTIRIDTGTGTPTAAAGQGGGWIYRPATGQIWIDHPDYVNTAY